MADSPDITDPVSHKAQITQFLDVHMSQSLGYTDLVSHIACITHSLDHIEVDVTEPGSHKMWMSQVMHGRKPGSHKNLDSQSLDVPEAVCPRVWTP